MAARPDAPAPRPGPLLLLHGHGDDPSSMAPVAAALTAALGVEVHRPAAPHRVDGGGLGWWPQDEDAPSEATVAGLIGLLPSVAPGAPPIVAGFSQGAATALAVAAAHGAALRVVVVAGFLAGAGAAPVAGSDVLVVRGELDEVVDPVHGALVARRCRSRGCAVTEVVRADLAHRWDDAVTAEVVRWLQR